MGKRKPVSLLKRPGAPGDASKKRRTADKPAAPQKPAARQHTLAPTSDVHRQAARAVGKLLQSDETGRDGASLKSLTLAPHVTNKKAVYAVTIETMKHVPVLEKLIERTGVAAAGPLSRGAALVLVRELLWGADGLKSTGPAEKAVLALETPLREALEAVLREAGVDDVSELLPAVRLEAAAAAHPRTARVNELQMTVEQALEWIRAPPAPHTRRWARVGAEASIDPHLPDLLVFPPGTDLHDHPLVESGALILQSKASCMTARALAPAPGATVVDCCAAPGNKTTHAAALVGRTGKVIAFDKDPTRLERLKGNAARAGAAGIISARVADFLSIDPSDSEFSKVEAVLLDPSCSGSGTTFSRMDHLLPSAAEKAFGAAAVAHTDARVEALAAFQATALRKALAFPAARRVAYSTCSLHGAENEGVVAAVLEEARATGWDLATALPQWPRRGVAGYGLNEAEAAMVVRTGKI